DDAWHAAEGTATGSFTRAILGRLLELGGASTLEPAELLDCRSPTDDRPYSWTRTVDGEQAVGAPEALMTLRESLFGDQAEQWHAALAGETEQGGRTLLLASRSGGGNWEPRALIVFADPLRPEARPSMEAAREAGIQAVVVTGDHPVTAAAIAREAGLDTSHVVTGADIDALDDDQLGAALPRLRGVPRALPPAATRPRDVAV